MFLGESENCKTIQIPTGLNLNCIDLGNPKIKWEQLNVTIKKRENWKSLKMCCYAKSCQEGCSGPITRHLIKKVLWSKKSHLLKKWTQPSMPMTKRVVGKHNVFSNSNQKCVLDTCFIQQDFSCVRHNEPKTILKNNWALASHYKKQKHFLKLWCFCKLAENMWLQPPELLWTII